MPWLAQAEYSDEYEAENTLNQLIYWRPDLKSYISRVKNYLLVRNSDEEKAREMELLFKYTKPMNTWVEEEKKPFLQKIGEIGGNLSSLGSG